jgi:hypothetical protein
MGMEADPLLLAGRGEPPLARLCIGAVVGADVELLGAALAGQRDRLGDRVAAAQEEPPRRSEASRSASASSMKATRFGAANRDPSRTSSKTNSGSVRSAAAAAASAGLSSTRRSRLKRITAVFICLP